MGNVLENLQSWSGGSVGRAEGVGAEEEEEDSERRSSFKIDHYLSNEENAYLSKLFQKYFDPEQKRFFNTFQSELQINGNNYTAFKVLNYLNLHHVDTQKKLAKFVVECGRIGSVKSFEMLWNVISCRSNPTESSSSSMCLVEDNILRFTKFLIVLAQPTISHESLIESSPALMEFFLSKLSTVCPKYQTEFEVNDFIAIVNSYVPNGSRAFQSYILVNFLSLNEEDAASSSFHHFHPVALVGTSDIINPTLVTLLSLYHQDLQSSWHRLYNSNTDGRSFNRIVFSLLGYEGPTLIFIKCGDKDKSIIGAYSAERWKDHNRFYGSSSNFLFTLFPRVRLYKARSTTNGSFQWLNTNSYGLPHGLGFGGSLEAFRLFIPESFENAVARDSCVTYDPGHLITSEANSFEIDSIEIWACGKQETIEKGLQAQHSSRLITKSNIEKARKVDKAAFFNSGFDREFLLANNFAHQKQTERPDVD